MQINYFSAIIILIVLYSCGGEPAVTFNEPQPTDTENILKFPDRMQGQYLSLADSSTLVIGDKLIQRIYDYDQKIHRSQLDSNSRLSGDTIINLTTNEREVIKLEGDSLLTHIQFIDTLFQMNYDNVVREFKGYYFMNKRFGGESWEVKKIELSRGQLVISSISTKEDMQNLKTITETTQDTVAPHNYSPTKKQFKEFIKNNGFTDSEKFIRKKENAI